MDLVGKKIGKLYVIEKTKEKEKSNHEYKYRCICDCGKEKLIRGSNLKSNNSKSCGCENIKKVATISKGYRNKNRRLYNIYQNMKQRCYYKKSIGYKNYGDRGIKVCDELSDLAGDVGLMFDRVEFVEDYLDDRYPRECHYSKTIREFAEEYPYGRYAVTMDGHITAIIDGKVVDTFYPNKVMRCAWRID